MKNILSFDAQNVTDFVQDRALAGESYLHVNTDKVSTYKDPIGGREFQVPGIITAVTRNVMRTEGVIAESLLGEAQALDDYAIRLQELEVNRREAEIQAILAKARRKQLGNDFASAGDADKADILVKLNTSEIEPDILAKLTSEPGNPPPSA